MLSQLPLLIFQVYVLWQEQVLGRGKKCFCPSAHQLLCRAACHSLCRRIPVIKDGEVWVCSSFYRLPQDVLGCFQS